MIATKAFVEAKVRYFNDLCFDASLPAIPIVLTSARSFLGKVNYRVNRGFFGKVTSRDNFTLRISTSFDLSESSLEDVILHELIHYYIAYNGIRDTSAHGKVFREMMNDFNSRFGRHISVRYRNFSGGDVHGGDGVVHRIIVRNKAEKPFWICASVLRNGAKGITVCSDAMMPRLKRSLPRYYSLTSTSWILSTNPYWLKYPKSRTPKIYKISDTDFDSLLRDSGITAVDRK